MVLIHSDPSFLPQMFTFVTLGPEIPPHGGFLATAPARTPLSPGAEQGRSQASASGKQKIADNLHLQLHFVCLQAGLEHSKCPLAIAHCHPRSKLRSNNSED